jgi:hypothetical protein
MMKKALPIFFYLLISISIFSCAKRGNVENGKFDPNAPIIYGKISILVDDKFMLEGHYSEFNIKNNACHISTSPKIITPYSYNITPIIGDNILTEDGLFVANLKNQKKEKIKLKFVNCVKYPAKKFSSINKQMADIKFKSGESSYIGDIKIYAKQKAPNEIAAGIIKILALFTLNDSYKAGKIFSADYEEIMGNPDIKVNKVDVLDNMSQTQEEVIEFLRNNYEHFDSEKFLANHNSKNIQSFLKLGS